MTFWFTPPTYEENLPTRNVLLCRYKLTRGYAVLKNGSVYTETTYPDQLTINEADHVYLGGHRHEVSAAEAALLESAGYDIEET